MEISNINLSRVFFAFTAMYHFLFVPLTIGLAALVACFEGIGLFTKNSNWARYARYWGWFFPLFFVCGLITGYPLRWQIDSHWNYYGEVIQQVISTVFEFEGKIFPFLILIVLLFTFGWKLPAKIHFFISLSLAVILVLQSSAILGLNAWMQNPVFSEMKDGILSVPDLWSLMLNPILPAKIFHQVISSWTLAGMLVVSISSYFLIKNRNAEIAKSSFKIANIFTLIGLIGTGIAGHWSGTTLIEHQPMKFAAIEAMWDTQNSDDFIVFAIPDQKERINKYSIEIPGLLKIITADSNTAIKGMDTLTQETVSKIETELKSEKNKKSNFDQQRNGYSGLMGKSDVSNKTKDIEKIAHEAIPNVKIVFFSFRVMMVSWALLMLIALINVFMIKNKPEPSKGWLWICVLSLPTPWIATEAGWLVCELGRQPWAVTGLLPTISGGSKLDSGQTGLQMLTYGLIYAAMFGVVTKLSLRHIKKGWPQIVK